jgi:protocatechuate 3,4-dioxygenase, alpha subunit
MKRWVTASQTVGPFFHIGLDQGDLSDLTRGGKAAGEIIVLSGRVLDGDGAPVPDALLELWQANAAGKYAHPEDRQAKQVDENFAGFGRCYTDRDGRYRFRTVRPGPVPGRGNALQAPHINLSLFARGVLTRLTTRIYFADCAEANESDPVLCRIEERRRASLLARPEGGAGEPSFRFDIVLQGAAETVFLDF